MLNMVNSVDGSNYEYLYRGSDAVNVFCSKINEIREDIKDKMKENKEIDMSDENKKDFKMELIVLFVVINLDMIIRMKRKQRNIRRFATIAILLVNIGVVLIEM